MYWVKAQPSVFSHLNYRQEHHRAVTEQIFSRETLFLHRMPTDNMFLFYFHYLSVENQSKTVIDIPWLSSVLVPYAQFM